MAISDRITAITNHLTDDWNSIDRLGLHTNILPKEYTQVDYIESSGTQYIDTGFKPNQDTRVYTKTYFNVSAAASHLFGAREGSNTKLYSFSSWNGLYETKYYNDTLTIETQTQPMIVDKNKNITTIGNIVKENDYITFSTPVNMYIFATNDNGSIFGETGTKRIYWFKLYDNGTLVRDFIPCFRNSNNEVGLYDIVNDVFYTNQGTGTFVYGQVQEEHIDKNIENIKEPLDLFYNEVSNKTDISVNGIVGRTSQETTTGKNILTQNSQYNNTSTGVTGSYNNTTGEFTISGKATAGGNAQVTAQQVPLVLSSGTTLTFSSTETMPRQIYIHAHKISGGFQNLLISANNKYGTYTLEDDIDYYNLRFNVENTVEYDFTTKFQLEIGSTATNWEKFTFGASPNPDYPQPINNLSGDIPYKVSGKNLLDENYYNNSSLYATSGLYYAFVELPDTFKTKFYVNMSVKGTNQNLVFGFIDTTSSTFVDGIMVLNNGTLNSNVECDFTNAEHVYIGIGNGSTIDKNTDIARIFDNYNIMVSTTSGEQYEPYILQTFNIPLTEITLPNFISGYVDYDGQIVTPSNTFITTNDYIEVKPNTQYTFKANTSGTRVLIGEYNINKEFIPQRKEIVIGNTYTTVNNAKYIKFSVPTDSTNIEIYETSKPPIELCNIDTYEDKIYSNNGRLYLEKKNGKVVLNGSEHWTQAQQGYFADANMFPNRDLLAYKGYCNYFIVNDTSTTWTNLYYCGWSSIGLFWIRDDYTLASTQVEFKQWVSAHNLHVYYVLETPTTTEITQENYPSLYNALKQIQDYLTAYKINKEFILGYSSPEIEY